METRRAPEDSPIEFIRRLLYHRDFVGVRFMVKRNKQVGNKRIELDQALAISDVLLAAEKRLPNGSMDYYGILRVTRFGSVVLEDFKMLTKLLDGKQNGFPNSDEAAQHALQAWSFLSKPHMKKKYDLELMKHENKTSVGGRWKPSEDRKLKSLVELYNRPTNWKFIAEKMHGRTDKTCRWRWCNYLDSSINRGPLSDWEEQLLLDSQRELGNRWSRISQRFHRRTYTDLRYHWHKIMKSKAREQSVVDHREDLLN